MSRRPSIVCTPSPTLLLNYGSTRNKTSVQLVTTLQSMFRHDDGLSVDEERRLTVSDVDERQQFRGVFFRRAENLIPTDCVECVRTVNLEEGLSRTEVVYVTAGGNLI